MKDINLLEETILATMLKEQYLILDSELSDHYFSIGENQRLFDIFKSIKLKDLTVDMVTIAQHDVSVFGGMAKIVRLQSMGNLKKFDDYVEVLMNNWREKEKLSILNMAIQDNLPIEDVQNALQSISNNKMNDRKELKEILIEAMERPFKPMSKTYACLTGIKDLDILMPGFKRSTLTILGARPAMGKTDVMLHCVKSAHKQDFIPVVFSLEMAAEELADRMLAAEGNINRNKFRDLNKYLSDEQKSMWGSIVGEVSTNSLVVFDAPAQSLQEMRSKVRKITLENKGKELIIFIDYLTIIGGRRNNQNNYDFINETVRGLKNLSKEFNIPVVCLAQLSRACEQRPDKIDSLTKEKIPGKIPILSDLRDSGEIEQAADNVLFLYRDEYYDEESKEKGILRIVVAKQRAGATGTVLTAYKKEIGKILDLVR